ncbi:hypothetical protein TNCV_3467091 [Trichonephila clavipes]|nr:hypothetical protein TNCV_3467091 [Trichonephila clavipes]
MTLHSSTENSLAVLNRKILEANSQIQNAKLGGHQTCLSINRLWHELIDMLRRLVGTTDVQDIMIVQFRKEMLVIMAQYRSPLTVTLWPLSFLKTCDSTLPIKRTKHSVFLDVTVFDIHLWISYKCGSFVC